LEESFASRQALNLRGKVVVSQLFVIIFIFNGLLHPGDLHPQLFVGKLQLINLPCDQGFFGAENRLLLHYSAPIIHEVRCQSVGVQLVHVTEGLVPTGMRQDGPLAETVLTALFEICACTHRMHRLLNVLVHLHV
jgi:hypothetical protein